MEALVETFLSKKYDFKKRGYRSSCPEVFYKIGGLKKFAKFKGTAVFL